MKKVTAFKSLCWIFAFITFFSSCYRDSFLEETSTSVEGFVADQNGNRIRDAIVFYETSSNFARTDDNGHYKLTHVPEEMLTFIASAPMYLPRKVALKIPANNTQKGINFILDEQPGLIQNVKAIVLGELKVRIDWETQFSGDSQVEFGPNAAFGFMSERNLTPTKQHSIILKDLEPGLQYYFRVRSFDPRGYLHLQNGLAFIARDFLHTPGKPEAPKNLKLSLQQREGEIKIQWEANPINQDVIGHNIYRATSKAGPYKKINEIPVPEGFNTLLDQNLLSLQKYYYQVRAIDGENLESDPAEIQSIVISGNLSQSMLWLKAENPYIVEGDISVESNGSLRVEDGVIISFKPDTRNTQIHADRVEILIKGSLNLLGIASEPIIINGFNGKKNAWSGIIFQENCQPSQINFCQFSGSIDAGVDIRDRVVMIQECLFTFCMKGLLLQNISKYTLKSLVFNQVDDAIYIKDCSDITVKEIEIFESSRAVNVQSVASFCFAYNDLRSSDDFSLRINNPKKTTFINNNIIAPLLGNGIELNVASAAVLYNTIHTQNTGIKLVTGEASIKNNILFSFPTQGAVGIDNDLSTVNTAFNSAVNYNLDYRNVSGTNLNLQRPDFFAGSPFDYRINAGDPHLTSSENGGQLGRFGTLQ
ncbi:right-handed parallel beta-helix repeat-containing protein [Candidatus Riflebacteria bacterium]